MYHSVQLLLVAFGFVFLTFWSALGSSSRAAAADDVENRDRVFVQHVCKIGLSPQSISKHDSIFPIKMVMVVKLGHVD